MAEHHVHQDGTSARVRVGDVVVVHLVEPGATGYQWTAAVDGTSMTEESTAVEFPAGSPPGRSGERLFSFRAVSTGTTLLTLTLARAWEDGAVAQRWTVEVEVG